MPSLQAPCDTSSSRRIKVVQLGRNSSPSTHNQIAFLKGITFLVSQKQHIFLTKYKIDSFSTCSREKCIWQRTSRSSWKDAYILTTPLRSNILIKIVIVVTICSPAMTSECLPLLLFFFFLVESRFSFEVEETRSGEVVH